ncbi:MAG: FAD-dependent oxidoreductase [Sphingomonas sp.]|jgi:monoamine oxidase|uniref:flavin monoamine oxidase family protein n=1 Tax=Sphingomonas sp. TaxID=28214 RepID=UPI0035650011
MRGSSTFWGALESARRMNLAAAGEKPPVEGSPGLSRRALLKAIGAAGLVAAVPRPLRAAPIHGPVAIIGGGIAGLTALWHLTQAGIDARIYEARPRLGGRMFTHRPADGVPMEIGGQLVNTDHDDMHKLAKAFDIGLVDRKGEAHRTVVLANGAILSTAALAEALRPIAAQIALDSDRLDKAYERTARELDRLSISAYLDKHADKLPQPWVRQLMEATSRTEYGVEPGQASAIELVFNLPTVDGERVDVLSHSDERYLIDGGSGALIAAMQAKLGDRIETGKRLLRLDAYGAGARLTFLDGTSVTAGAVIVAVPAPLMRQIDFRVPLPPLWRRFIAEVDLGYNEKVQAVMTSRPWEGPMGRGGELWQTDASAGAALGWDGGIRPATDAGSVWTWFLGGDEVTAADTMDANQLARRFAAMAEGGVPGFGAAMSGVVRRTGWHRDPLTLGAYVNFRPGQLTRFGELIWVEGESGPKHRALAGRLQFAGEHLSDAYPGYMNGGAQTGRMAAEAIMAARHA